MASYVERLTKIRDTLESTADNIDEKDSPSEKDEEKSEAYRSATEFIDEAILALEEIE